MRFYTIFLILIALGFSSLVSAQDAGKLSHRLEKILKSQSSDETALAWVYFTDKGTDLNLKLEQTEQSLIPRAYQRRLRNRGANNLVDFYDIPVEASYVARVKERVQRLRHKSRWLNAVSVEATKAQIEQLAGLPFVKKIDWVFTATKPLPDLETVPPEDLPTPPIEGTHSLDYGSSLNQNLQINVVALHDLGYDGSGVTIANLDAGFNNLQHESLQHLNILAAWDFVNGDSIVSDEPGQMGSGNHGTLTLSAQGGFKEGELIGPAYGANYLLAKTENTDWERHIEEDHWVAGAEWADSLGADVISSSLGYRDGFTNGEFDYTWQDMDGNTTIVVQGADIAASRGIIVVTSAGNEGSAFPPENTIVSPTDGDSVLSVGAVSANGNRTSFSSMGPTADGRIKPDVMALGSSTYCASPYSPTGYTTASGTSLSCPLAAGAAALILQANPNATNMDVINAMHNTASNAANPNNQMGWGIVNAYDAAFAVTGLGDDPKPRIAEQIKLYPAYPNPFNPSTTIRYSLPERTEVSLAVYNLLGQEIARLTAGVQTAGEHQVVWNAEGMPSGLYYVVLKSRNQKQVQKAVLIK